jgi:hypothetical protein
MLRSLLIPTAVLTSALALGCAEQQPPTAPAVGSTASPTFARTAGSSGAVVVRDAVPFGFFIVDEDPELTTLIGLTAADLAQWCVSGTLPELVDVLAVERPTGAVKVLFKDEDIRVTVWPVSTFDLCGVLTVTSPLAEGTAHFVNRDNGRNTFGISAQGTVANVETGEQLKYLAILRAIISPSGELRFPVADIKLQ